MIYKYLARPLLFSFPSDPVHEATIKAGAVASKNRVIRKLAKVMYSYENASLEQKFWGLTFKNPVGLAAGFDKNGHLLPLLEEIGFGFAEIGSITAKASPGNPKPRSFRLRADQSLINRMGLNNDGAETIIRRLKQKEHNIPMGINIAKTHSAQIIGSDALDDYLFSFNLAKEIADYITLNISCPNTTEGKTFEDVEALSALLNHLEINKDATIPPVLVKFSVDLADELLKELISVCEDFAVSGYVAVNTSNSREGLATSNTRLEKIGRGGLSGKAINQHSTEIIRSIKELTNGDKVIIGVGGIFSSEDAIAKLEAGADLLQVYTGLVYEGPGLVRKINRGIAEYMRKKELNQIYEIRRVESGSISRE
jgi:dihydroorotate dehydrogenase